MRIIVILSLVILSLPTWANKMGLGVSVGNPTGLNGKYWVDSSHAIDGGVAMSLGRSTNLSLHSDYLFHRPESFYLNDIYALDLHYGIGGRMEFSDSPEVGVRLPVGLVYNPNSQSDLFGEVAPVVDFIGRTGLELHLLFGARYYF
jgi:hypothetical protein